MKNIIKYFWIACTLLTVACDRSDPGEEFDATILAPAFSNDVAGEAEKSAYEATGFVFSHDFTDDFYKYGWTGDISRVDETLTRVQSDGLDNVPEFIDLVRKNVFDVLPKKVLANVNRYILIADSIPCPLINSTLKDTIHQNIPGELQANYMLLTHAGKSFNAEEVDSLRKHWVSLFVEKAVTNLAIYPQDFLNISMAYTSAEKGFSTTYGSVYDASGNYSTSNKYDPINWGFVAPQRTYIYRFTWTSKTNPTYKLIYYNDKKKIYEDFGDYVAFILYVPDARKQAYYAANPDIERKVKLCQTYCATNFDWTPECLVN